MPSFTPHTTFRLRYLTVSWAVLYSQYLRGAAFDSSAEMLHDRLLQTGLLLIVTHIPHFTEFTRKF